MSLFLAVVIMGPAWRYLRGHLIIRSGLGFEREFGL